MGAPTYINGELILPGHWIKVMVPILGGIWHHGIIRRITRGGNGEYVIEVIHNTKDGGVAVSSLDDFADGRLVLLERRPSSPEHAQVILATADANIGKAYSVFSQNCEHFCSFCYTWEAKSDTLQTFVGLTTVGVLAFIAWNSDDSR